MPTVPSDASIHEYAGPHTPIAPWLIQPLNSPPSFPHIFDHFVSATGARFRSTEPRVDVVESGVSPWAAFSASSADADPPQTTVTFIVNLPGVPKSSLDITVHEGTLTVSASWGSAHADAVKVEVEERPKGSFKRMFRVPRWLNAAGITAKLEDGVLRIEYEKRGPEKEGEKVVVL
mgnify:FL=1